MPRRSPANITRPNVSCSLTGLPRSRNSLTGSQGQKKKSHQAWWRSRGTDDLLSAADQIVHHITAAISARPRAWQKRPRSLFIRVFYLFSIELNWRKYFHPRGTAAAIFLRVIYWPRSFARVYLYSALAKRRWLGGIIFKAHTHAIHSERVGNIFIYLIRFYTRIIRRRVGGSTLFTTSFFYSLFSYNLILYMCNWIFLRLPPYFLIEQKKADKFTGPDNNFLLEQLAIKLRDWHGKQKNGGNGRGWSARKKKLMIHLDTGERHSILRKDFIG